MHCMNGILILNDDDRRILTLDLGEPPSPYVAVVLDQLEAAADRREAEGNPTWANMIRRTRDLVIRSRVEAGWTCQEGEGDGKSRVLHTPSSRMH